LQKRIEDLGLEPIPGAVVASSGSDSNWRRIEQQRGAAHAESQKKMPDSGLGPDGTGCAAHFPTWSM
jgi:hypothetical protein